MLSSYLCDSNTNTCTRAKKAPGHRPQHIRRSLASITPSNSHPQSSSRLFSTLPSEIRTQIYEYALCQVPTHDQPVSASSHQYRPGHTHRASISTSILQTCGLVYYEAHTIPLRSATHHVYEFESRLGVNNPDEEDHYLDHLVSPYLYHLHHSMGVVQYFGLARYVRHEYLPWKKITFTIRSSFWPRVNWERQSGCAEIEVDLQALVLPSSCHEVNLELEVTRIGNRLGEWIAEKVKKCRAIGLKRGDGVVLSVDETACEAYSWTGTRQGGSCNPRHNNGSAEVAYYVKRICWRSRVLKREYMSLDHWNCLEDAAVENGKSESG